MCPIYFRNVFQNLQAKVRTASQQCFADQIAYSSDLHNIQMTQAYFIYNQEFATIHTTNLGDYFHKPVDKM